MNLHGVPDGGNDAGGIGRHGCAADVLVPRTVCGKKRLAEQLAHRRRDGNDDGRYQEQGRQPFPVSFEWAHVIRGSYSAASASTNAASPMPSRAFEFNAR